jgi:hypothetical protein
MGHCIQRKSSGKTAYFLPFISAFKLGFRIKMATIPVFADLLRVAALFKGAGEHQVRDLGELYRTRQEKRGINLAVFEEKIPKGRPAGAIKLIN